jgi:hypothetical protein
MLAASRADAGSGCWFGLSHCLVPSVVLPSVLALVWPQQLGTTVWFVHHCITHPPPPPRPSQSRGMLQQMWIAGVAAQSGAPIDGV